MVEICCVCLHVRWGRHVGETPVTEGGCRVKLNRRAFSAEVNELSNTSTMPSRHALTHNFFFFLMNSCHKGWTVTTRMCLIKLNIKSNRRLMWVRNILFYSALIRNWLTFWRTFLLASCNTAGFNPLNPELNPICYLPALLGAHHFLHVSRIRVKSLTLRLLMSYIYGAPILDVSRSHTTTQHSR